MRFDDLVHVTLPLLTAPVVYIALARLDVVPDPRDETHLRHYIGIAVATAALGITVGALWEVYEWRSDAWLGTDLSESNDATNGDTNGDLVRDALGSITGAALLVAWSSPVPPPSTCSSRPSISTGPTDLSAFDTAFEPTRTDYDWLSRDDAQVDAYVADPRCGFGLSAPDNKQMFVSARQLADPGRLGRVRTDLPVYVAVGDQDPVNGQLTLVHGLVQRLEAARFEVVTLVVREGARHEVFNETNRAEVVADLLRWLDRVVPAS